MHDGEQVLPDELQACAACSDLVRAQSWMAAVAEALDEINKELEQLAQTATPALCGPVAAFACYSSSQTHRLQLALEQPRNCFAFLHFLSRGQRHAMAAHGMLYYIRHASDGGGLDGRVRMADAAGVLAVDDDAVARSSVSFHGVIKQ